MRLYEKIYGLWNILKKHCTGTSIVHNQAGNQKIKKLKDQRGSICFKNSFVPHKKLQNTELQMKKMVAQIFHFLSL